MKKWLFIINIVILQTLSVKAQSIEDGLNALYYEKHKKAQEIFENIIQKNPSDTKAIYWLGQVYLENQSSNDAIDKVKKLYQTALNKYYNDAYLLVGMGQITLETSHDIVSAKQKFDQAIVTSKDDPQILNAIGRANAAGTKSDGDPAYAIEVLKKASLIDKTNPDILLNLANNILKLDPGAINTATQTLLEAIKIKPNYAKAYYQLGKINYEANPVLANDYFLKAIQSDSNYSPSYLWLFRLAMKDSNYNLAENYINKYQELTEDKIKSQYYIAILQLDKKNYSLAQNAIRAYLSNTPTSKIAKDADLLAGNIFKTEPDSAIVYYKRAAITGNSKNKLEALDSLIGIYSQQRDTSNIFIWTKNKLLALPPSEEAYKNEQIIPQLCMLATKASNLFKEEAQYQFIDSIFQIYITKNKDVEWGYYGIVKIASQMDPSLRKAKKPIIAYLSFLEKDKDKYKNKLIYYHDLLGQYYTNIEKNYAQSALQYKAILELDSNNARAKDILDKIRQVEKK